MTKTVFSKSELMQLHKILASEKFIPCDRIGVYTDEFNSGTGSIYNVIKFIKGKKQLNIGFITKTYPNISKLQEQINEYFGGEE